MLHRKARPGVQALGARPLSKIQPCSLPAALVTGQPQKRVAQNLSNHCCKWINVPLALRGQNYNLKGDYMPPTPYPTGPLPSPNAILSLCSRNSLIEEGICVTGVACAHRIACEISVKLPKDIWKGKGAQDTEGLGWKAECAPERRWGLK